MKRDLSLTLVSFTSPPTNKLMSVPHETLVRPPLSPLRKHLVSIVSGHVPPSTVRITNALQRRSQSIGHTSVSATEYVRKIWESMLTVYGVAKVMSLLEKGGSDHSGASGALSGVLCARPVLYRAFSVRVGVGPARLLI